MRHSASGHLTVVNRLQKIFYEFHLNDKRLFVKIVELQNNMVRFNDMANQFIPSANVGNLVLVLIIVVTGLLKPAGAFME